LRALGLVESGFFNQQKLRMGKNMFKGKYLLLGAVSLLCASGAQASVTLLSDGFEAAGSPTNPPWQSFVAGNGSTISRSTVSPFAGAASLSLDNQALGAANFVKAQQVGAGTINTGDSITISGYVKGSLGVSGDVQIVAFSEACAPPGGCGTTGSTQVFSLAGGLSPTTWTAFTKTFTIDGNTAGGITVQLSTVTGAVAGAYATAFFDNVSIIDNTTAPVPVPASLWLLGSALLGGLGVFRRKAIAA
jgi:hypothetical protein